MEQNNALPGQGVPSATSIDYFGRAPFPGQAQGDAQMSLASEFKEFAMRGNVIDLAVGVVIGGFDPGDDGAVAGAQHIKAHGRQRRRSASRLRKRDPNRAIDGPGDHVGHVGRESWPCAASGWRGREFH